MSRKQVPLWAGVKPRREWAAERSTEAGNGGRKGAWRRDPGKSARRRLSPSRGREVSEWEMRK